jgi:sensor histidine kinase YesM
MEPLIDYLLRFHQRHRALTHVLFWASAYGLAFVEPTNGLSVWQHGLVIVSTALSRIPKAYLMVYWLLPRFVERGRYWLAGLLFGVVSYLMYALSVGINNLVLPAAGLQLSADNMLLAALLNGNAFWQKYLLGHLGGAAALLLIKLLLNRSEVQRRALTLEKQKAELELKLLKTQLNPHFLFNTLNNLYSLAVQQSPKTADAIARLAEMLDYMLYRCNDRMVALSGEIALIEHYIALEKLRYDDRLQVCFDHKGQANVAVAPLLLLSLVENAFKHGASEDAGSPIITIRLTVKAQVLMFRVENSVGPYIPNRPRGQLGLPNLKQQLELIYPGAHSLTISQTDNRFVVSLQIQNLLVGDIYENALSVS